MDSLSNDFALATDRLALSHKSFAMGVFKLRKFLEPYSETFALESGSAILDGPSFAYHIFYLCSRTVLQTTPFEQPSYELLGRTAISWLTAIRSHGYSM